VKIHMVVQANNFREMPAFVEIGARFAADRIYFSRLDQWGTFSKDEYRQRAVHRPEHPEHRELLAVLADSSLDDPRVELGNLSVLTTPSSTLAARPVQGIGRLVESYIG
jgi:hypothetical protein